jgi:glyoxylase-like metal-dependent hydrolase (beta-lactamase superfamily II)
MAPDPLISTFQVGDARVYAINTGGGQPVLASMLRTPPGGWTPEELALLEQPSPMPHRSLHVALGPASVVIDPMHRHAYLAAFGLSAQPHHVVAPRIDQQLAGLGIFPDKITHVVITHAHDDHFIVATVEGDDGERHPLFPAARYIAERADWTPEGKQTILASLPEDDRLPELADRVMGELFRHGLVDLVDGDYEVAPGIHVVLAPGETPGHAVVRVHSAGETLYYLGDLIHHPVEVAHPDWIPVWADPASTLASRRAIFSAAVAEDALLVASHIPGIGRIRAGASGMYWEPVR